MPLISVSRLRTGMLLAAPVLDVNGRRLFPAGHEVTPSTLRILAMWGIAQVDVTGPATTSPAPSRMDASACWREVKRRFHGCDLSHPHQHALAEEMACRLEARKPCGDPDGHADAGAPLGPGHRTTGQGGSEQPIAEHSAPEARTPKALTQGTHITGEASDTAAAAQRATTEAAPPAADTCGVPPATVATAASLIAPDKGMKGTCHGQPGTGTGPLRSAEAPAGTRYPTPRPAPVTLDMLLDMGSRLATLPETFHRLSEVLHDPTSTAADAAEIINHDPDLASRLLRFANSAYFGLRSPIDTINRAVIVIGIGQIMVIATGTCLMRVFRGVPSHVIDMHAFWKHSVSCGVAARLLAMQAGLPQTDRFFLSGLLHDIGRLVTFVHLPEHAAALLSAAQHEHARLIDLEPEIVGFGHDEVGATLLEHWNCPAYLIEDQRTMHHYGISEQRQAVLAVADSLANLFGPGTSGERLAPRIAPETWRAAGIAPAAMVHAASQIEPQMRDIMLCMEEL